MVKSEDEVHVCNVCGKQYLGERRLARHKLSHDTDRVRPYQCKLCDQGFFANCHLVNHMRTHTGEKPFKCTKCGKDFTQASALRRHESNIHNDSNPSKKVRQPPASTPAPSVQPAVPSDTENGEATPVVHMPKKKERPFGCYECGKFFTQLSTLYRHLRTVHGLEKYGKLKTRPSRKKRQQKKEDDGAGQVVTGSDPAPAKLVERKEEISSVTSGVLEAKPPETKPSPPPPPPPLSTPPPPLQDHRVVFITEGTKPYEKHILELHGQPHQVVHQYPSPQVTHHHHQPPPGIHVHHSDHAHHHQLLPLSDPPQPEKVVVTSSTEYEHYAVNQHAYYWPYNAVVTAAVDYSNNLAPPPPPPPPPSGYFEVSSSTSSPSPTFYSQQQMNGEGHEDPVDVAG